jgi:hypothetical protein
MWDKECRDQLKKEEPMNWYRHLLALAELAGATVTWQTRDVYNGQPAVHLTVPGGGKYYVVDLDGCSFYVKGMQSIPGDMVFYPVSWWRAAGFHVVQGDIIQF